jgi:hypothetical protein
MNRPIQILAKTASEDTDHAIKQINQAIAQLQVFNLGKDITAIRGVEVLLDAAKKTLVDVCCLMAVVSSEAEVERFKEMKIPEAIDTEGPMCFGCGTVGL